MELQIFNNNEFGQIRSLMLDDEVWFIGKDITLALGYSNDRKALQDNVDLEDRRLIISFSLSIVSFCGRIDKSSLNIRYIDTKSVSSISSTVFPACVLSIFISAISLISAFLISEMLLFL